MVIPAARANTRPPAIAAPIGARSILETWDDIAERRVDLSRATSRGNRAGRRGPAVPEGARPEVEAFRLHCRTTDSDNRIQIGTLSRNFRDRLARGRAPH
ncbi:hypothetical protein BC2230_11197 [Burkholderia cepacia]